MSIAFLCSYGKEHCSILTGDGLEILKSKLEDARFYAIEIEKKLAESRKERIKANNQAERFQSLYNQMERDRDDWRNSSLKHEKAHMQLKSDLNPDGSPLPDRKPTPGMKTLTIDVYPDKLEMIRKFADAQNMAQAIINKRKK